MGPDRNLQTDLQAFHSRQHLSYSASLQEAFDKGWRLGWRDWVYTDFQFEPLHQEPEFKRLITLLEDDMEVQRKAAYELLGLADFHP